MRKSSSLTIISLILYFLHALICGLLIGTIHINELWAESLSVFLTLVIVIFLIGKREYLAYYGIRLWECDNFIKTISILFLVPIVNIPYLFLGTKINIIYAFINSIYIGVMEELICRGFLCRFIEEKSNRKKAVFISSLLFGMFHLVNIGSFPLIYVFLQVLYAFAIGIAFALVFYKTKSLLACIAVHSIVDFLGSFGTEPIFAFELIGTIICILCAIYYYALFRKESI